MNKSEGQDSFLKKFKTHPKEKANFLSHLFFCWQLPVFVKGWRKELTEDCLHKPPRECESKRLGDTLEERWLEELQFSKKPSLFQVLLKIFGGEFFLYGIVLFPVDLISIFLQPYCLKKILEYFTPNQVEMTRKQGICYTFGLIFLIFIRSLFTQFSTMQLNVIGVKVQVACSSLIYRHVLKMKKTSIEKVTVGNIVNLLSNDINKFHRHIAYLHYIWMSPLEFVLVMSYVDLNFGHTAISGTAILVLFLICQMLVMAKYTDSKRRSAKETDCRLRLMNDFISGIQIVKMYAWEKPFIKLIDTARKTEIDEITCGINISSIFVAARVYVTKIVVVVVVVVSALMEVHLTPQYLFFLVRIYDMFRMTLVVMLPIVLMNLLELKVNVQRIQEFLLHDWEIPRLEQYVKKTEHLKKKSGVEINNIRLKLGTSHNDVLSRVNFRVSPGELVGIVGAAGSGKSILLHVILKEYEISEGSVKTEGSFSYASQEPWIFPSSVRQNILFGQPLNPEKYQHVISICALETDLTLFPHGDETLVGERGIMLSGGQKARINLARAIYRDADIYLLDDPLSAVDTKVTKKIFDQCISSYLRQKCVILVTHQSHFWDKLDRVYVFKSAGKLTENHKKLSENRQQNLPKIKAEKKIEFKVFPPEVKEHRSTSVGDFHRLKNYWTAGGHCCFILFVFILSTAAVFLSFCIDYSMTFFDTTVQERFSIHDFLYIYPVLVLLAIFFYHSAAFYMVKLCMGASKNLHSNMLVKIAYGAMTFFNYHSSGRILNRFSTDLGNIDEIVTNYCMICLNLLLCVIGMLILIVVINYWLILPTLFFLGFVYIYYHIYERTNTNIKRTEGITQSHVLTHLSSSLQGLSTIRALNAQKILTEEFHDHQDINTSARYTYITTFSAYGFWIDFTCAIYIAVVILSLFLLTQGDISVGYVGLALTQSCVLIEAVQHMMRIYSQLSASLTSVERVVEYISLDPELDNGTYIPDDTWPMMGNITFNSVSMKYRYDESPVLKNISVKINAGEKIGIVGRTGAGKTSVVFAIFRIFDYEGSVIIDGVDTHSIPLKTLRSKISIIPQNPVLFLGTLRKNIDPFNEFTDSQIWKALEELELKEMVFNLSGSLEFMVTEGGSNFSVGQRQLLCLLRAMLRSNRIVVLDEATANVDSKTDELIQKTIRKKFRNCTVLTIAHRLNTVVDCDKILVMDEGQVVEFDQPSKLMKNTKGFFYNYVKENDADMERKFLKGSFEE